jgi:hypothetical protein
MALTGHCRSHSKLPTGVPGTLFLGLVSRDGGEDELAARPLQLAISEAGPAEVRKC